MDILKAWAKLLIGRGSRRSYSQFGEDAIIAAIFRHKEDGFYVDIGSYHPTLYSNTYALYRRGWEGVVVDPNPRMERLFAWLRPRDRFVHAAVGKDASTAPYYEYADGAYNSLSAAQVEALALKKGVKPLRTSEIAVRPLGELLKANGVTHIDFMNIDVEGMDLAVLSSHDWSLRPAALAVEDDSFNAAAPDSSDVYQFLTAKGYKLRAHAGPTLIFCDTVVA